MSAKKAAAAANDPGKTIGAIYCLPTKLLRELCVYMSHFNEDGMLTLSREKMQAQFMDTSHTSIICFELYSASMLKATWNNKVFTTPLIDIGFKTKSWSKVLDHGSGSKHMLVCLCFSENETMFEFYEEDLARPYTERYQVRNIDVRGEKMEIPPFEPDVKFRVRSLPLRKLVAFWFKESENINLLVEYGQQQQQKKKKASEQQDNAIRAELKKGSHPTSSATTTGYLVPVGIRFSCENPATGFSGDAPYSLIESASKIVPTPPPQPLEEEEADGFNEADENATSAGGSRIATEGAEEEEEEAWMRVTIKQEVKDVEMNEMPTNKRKRKMAEKKDSEEASLGTRVGLRLSHHTTCSVPMERIILGPKLVNFATMPCAMANHVDISIGSTTPVCFGYDLGKYGTLSCFVAPKINSAEDQ